MGGTNDGRKFLDYIPKELVAAKRSTVMEIDLVNGSMIKLVGSDNYDSLMGLNAMGAVFTEYSLQKPEAWDYIRPMLSANGGWALFNYTVRGMNHGYKMAKMAKSNPKWFYQYLTRDNTGFPTLEAIQDDREAGMRESLIQQEYYNDWNASSEETFIPLDLVSPCVDKSAELNATQYINEPRILGCDVAYAAKGDKATICFRQGRKVHFLRWYRGMDNQAFADEIFRYYKAIKPHAIFIDAGRGEGVISRLDRLGISHVIFPIHFGGKVYEEGIANMKAIMWVRMMEWFLDTNKPDLTGLDTCKYANEPVEEQLLYELSLPFMIKNEKNQVAVESKAALKTRGEKSPDLAESVGLTFAGIVDREDILTPRQEALGLTLDGFQEEKPYDPLTYCDDYAGSAYKWG